MIAKMPLTFRDIAKDYVSKLTPDKCAEILESRDSPNPCIQVWVEMDVMTSIRIDYGLWYDHPLTERWRTDISTRIILDGVDCSKDHPDSISEIIFHEVVNVIYNQSLKL